MKNKQLNIIYHSCHIARAHFLEHDQMNQFQEHISNQNQNTWVSMLLWIVFSSCWTYVHTWYFIEISWSSSSSSQEIIQSSRNIVLLQAVFYHKSCNLIQQHSVFVKKKQLSIIHHFYHIVRVHFSEYNQINQLQEHISNQNQNMQVLMLL